MRIIAGHARGRTLQAPKGQTTRPTPDRVREALFSAIAAHVENASVLDLFAGSGAMGLEALSRGAQDVTFVEHSFSALAALRHNVTVVAPAPAAVTVLPMGVLHALAALGKKARRFDLIIMDPPYADAAVEPTLNALVAHKLLSEDGLIVAEHAGKACSPVAPAALACHWHRRYGEVAISLYRRAFATPCED
jgi:16S rRNA (guanine966-N2)-methyltransferase